MGTAASNESTENNFKDRTKLVGEQKELLEKEDTLRNGGPCSLLSLFIAGIGNGLRSFKENKIV